MESFYFGIKKWFHLVVDDGLKKKEPCSPGVMVNCEFFLGNFVELSYFVDFVVGFKVWTCHISDRHYATVSRLLLKESLKLYFGL